MDIEAQHAATMMAAAARAVVESWRIGVVPEVSLFSN